MKKIIVFNLLIVFISCSTSKTGSNENTSNANYGYSKDNPIKVGGNSNGPANERNYLNSLSGPNGEQVTYSRSGSCCHFETKNSSFGMGMLDIYRVTYEGKKDTISLYLNMYDKETLKCPVGFKFK